MKAKERRANGKVVRIGFAGNDAELARALVRGDPGAPSALYDRYASHLQRVLARVLGVDAELPDVLHETFAQILSSVHGLDEPARLKAWITRVAVFTARGWIRRRARKRWLRFFAPEELPEPEVNEPHEEREALQRTYRVLDKLPADERIAFALRVIDGMPAADVAAACGVSLATIKRRTRRARDRFTTLARRDPLLRRYLEEGES